VVGNGATASAATIPEAPSVGFTTAQSARLSGCSAAQLRHWARSGLVPATEPDGRYGFRDLVALRIVRSMLDTGLPTTRVRTALAAVRDAGHDLTSLRLITDGRQVWACHDDGEILDALRAGQLALFVAVDQVAADVDADVRAFSSERAEFVERLTAQGS
jgi:DNA-binding transcriptional MerR regulator